MTEWEKENLKLIKLQVGSGWTSTTLSLGSLALAGIALYNTNEKSAATVNAPQPTNSGAPGHPGH